MKWYVPAGIFLVIVIIAFIVVQKLLKNKCPQGEFPCGGGPCVNILTDFNNCGSCGAPCGKDGAGAQIPCQMGRCVPP